MLSNKKTLLLAILLLTFQAIIHLVRLFWDIPFSIGSLTFPGWTGGIFFLGLGLLAVWSFRALAALYDQPPTDLSNL